MNDQELLNASQAAEALSASSQTIRNWTRSNRLQAVRIGNRFLIPRDGARPGDVGRVGCDVQLVSAPAGDV
jgi:excisionase family DNA binding protein